LELTAALTQTTHTFQGDRLLIEPKEMVKQRLGYSPDHADALCLTFAYPVVRKAQGLLGAAREIPSIDAVYQPFADAWKTGGNAELVRDCWPGMLHWSRR
jgi:hypothetical protein